MVDGRVITVEHQAENQITKHICPNCEQPVEGVNGKWACTICNYIPEVEDEQSDCPV